jgi:hypothetical protein
MRASTLVNGALLALALGSLAVVWATREAPTTSQLAERKNKLLPAFQGEDVRRISLERAPRELVLERKGDELELSKPWAERADIATVRQLLGGLELASALRPADGVSAQAAGLGAGSLVIRVDAADKVLKIRLGGAAPAPPGARYAEVEAAGERRMFVVSQGVAAELDLPFEKFRETRLLEYGRRELAKISITQGASRLELEQRAHEAFFVRVGQTWQLASREATETVLTALSRLASEQLLEAEQARAALGPDALQAHLELADKAVPPIELHFAQHCPRAPEQALVLREQSGKAPRAGCIPGELLAALSLSAEDARLLGPFSARPDEVEELKLTRGEQKLDLVRKEQAFVLRGNPPSDVPLDAGNQRLAAIVGARGSLSNAAFEPAGEITIQIAGGDEAAHREERVSVSRPSADGHVCVKRAADGITLCFDAETARAFEPDATSLRSLSVLSFAASDVRSFNVVAPGLSERVVRRDDGGYELQQPPGFVHDGALVANFLQTLGALQAARWVASADEPRFGLASPRLRVTVTLVGNAAPRELLVGAPAPGGYFARLLPDPGVFVLPGSAFLDLAAPLVDRSLAPFSESELAHAELRAGRGQPQGLSGPLLSTVSSLRAEQTVHLGPAKPGEGFEKPLLSLSLTGKSGKTARLLVGACDTLDDAAVCYARLDGVDATFALSRRLVAELQDFAQDAH